MASTVARADRGVPSDLRAKSDPVPELSSPPLIQAENDLEERYRQSSRGKKARLDP